MTAIVILNVTLVAVVLLTICGGLIWTILSQPDAGPLVRLPRRQVAKRAGAPVPTRRLSQGAA